MEKVTLGSVKQKDVVSFGGVLFKVEGKPDEGHEDRLISCTIMGTDSMVHITSSALVTPI